MSNRECRQLINVLATHCKEGNCSDCLLTHSLSLSNTHPHTHTDTLTLLAALSIFFLIRAFGQPATLKGHHGTANCLIKKFGGAQGAPGRAQKGPAVHVALRLSVPEAVPYGEYSHWKLWPQPLTLSIYTLFRQLRGVIPCYHFVSICLSTSTSLSFCLSFYLLCH